MTVLVTVQAAGVMTRLRRYETAMMGGHVCSHEGLYDPETVTPSNVNYYFEGRADQDLRSHPGSPGAAARRPA